MIKSFINSYPRVLIITGEPFSKSTATGITLQGLFGDWPKERLFQIYTTKLESESTSAVKNIELTPASLVPFFYFPRRDKVSTYIERRPTDSVRRSRFVSFRQIIRRYFIPIIDLLPYKLDKEQILRIEEFEPDAIYTLLGNIRLTRLAYSLSKRLNIPVVPHFMDDWLATYSVPGKSNGGRVHRFLLEFAVSKLFSRTKFAMAISDKMKEEYSCRFSTQFFTFMNPVNEIKAEREYAFSENNNFRFIYFGGLHLGRLKVLRQLAEILKSLADDGYSLELKIYAPYGEASEIKVLESKYQFIKYGGYLDYVNSNAIISEFSIGIQLESFDSNIKKYTRLSLSTKIPQYLAAGLPILAVAPDDIASSEYIFDNDVGIVVAADFNAKNISIIKNFIADVVRRQQFSCNAIRLAQNAHMSESVRGRFRDVLMSAVLAECK